MSDLELTVLQRANDELGHLAGVIVTDQMIVGLGGITNRAPTVVASANGRDFEVRSTPGGVGLRDVIAVADAIWACGEYGQLAVSRDHGASWAVIETGTEACLFGLALAADGALWVVGDHGYAARILGTRVTPIDLGTTAKLTAVYAIRNELVVLGADGLVRVWRVRGGRGAVEVIACGAKAPLTGLAITSKGTWLVVGDGGFIARSPDGQWYSRVYVGTATGGTVTGGTVTGDLEAIATLPDDTTIVVGDRGQIVVSGDDGRTWRAIPCDLGLAHLWSITRFGGGVLIGGDRGLIVKLAPPGDATWRDRGPALDDARSLDAVFEAGPIDFIERGLTAYLAAVVQAAELVDGDDGEDEDGDDDDDDDEDDDDDDDEDGDDDDDDDDDDEDDAEDDAIKVLARPGTADDFRAIYGIALPAEARQFFERVAGHDPWNSFEELGQDSALLPDVGEHNLFELLIRRNQRAYLGTDLAEAFTGVVEIGSQGNGDSYHLELYEWDGRRQVLHHDHETATFSGVFADSLDSLVYLAAIVKAGEERWIAKDVYAGGIVQLRRKVAPTWHFSLDDQDPGFEPLEPRRRDSELFFHRARWICALLAHDGVTEIEDIPALFLPALNGVLPPDQLPARLEACEQRIPTALYAMWRAFLFDEPELASYLAVGRRHAARLVRDAATLIDELLAGRNELGTIRDVRAHVAAFRALDLDPRRAAAREAEADARARQATARTAEAMTELAAVEPARWSELAWRWLGDGVAHRALLERLDHVQGPQIAALDGLRELRDDERAVALPRLARELSSELEAVLVGSLVRDDDLAGVLYRRRVSADAAAAHAADDDEDADGRAAPGWAAIDAALRPLYGDAEPQHYSAILPYQLGGNDPLHGISAYPRSEPVPHWHFVTYGFTDLFRATSSTEEESGFGFELTFRLARDHADDEPPAWVLDFLQNLARYVFGTGNRFAPGHKMGLNGPMALDHATRITAICFTDDPELGRFESPFGRARFVQVVGITDDEYQLIQEWSTSGLVDILRQRLPYLVTRLTRDSVLVDPVTITQIEEHVARDGSSEELTFAGELAIALDDGNVRIELGALYAAALPRAMRGRILHGRPYELRGRDRTLHLRAASSPGCTAEGDACVVAVTPALAHELEHALAACTAGVYRFEAWPALEIVVTPSFLHGHDGEAIEVRGIADPDRARQLLDAENARLAAERIADVDDDDADAGEVAAPPPADRVLAALAMTERALRLAPGDTDVQFTHAMLLLDGERAGLAGKAEELVTWLVRFARSVQVNVAVRMADLDHPRFAEAVDIVLRGELDAVPDELYASLADAILERAPHQLRRLVPVLPDDVTLLGELAYKAIEAGERDVAIALYDRLLALPFPDEGDDRTGYLRSLNNACIQAHAARAFEAAVRIADRAQAVAHENPYLYHSAACAYAAVGDHAKAFEQVKLAVEHEYDHLAQIEVDTDLGELLEWPAFQALFRAWHAEREGN